MQRVKKIPRRQCIGCREMKEKKALIRVVRSPEGEISPDPYCVRKARKSKALERAFETSVPPEVYDALERQLGAQDGTK